jgi:hypothetical protein
MQSANHLDRYQQNMKKDKRLFERKQNLKKKAG